MFWKLQSSRGSGVLFFTFTDDDTCLNDDLATSFDSTAALVANGRVRERSTELCAWM